MDPLPEIRENFNISDYNTMGVDAKVRYFASVENAEQIRSLLSNTEYEHIPLYVLGGGSNVLFMNDYAGMVLHMSLLGKKVIREDDDHIWLKIGAGENWHELVCYCVEKGWGGIENLSLIPGTAGAAPIQNIGAYGVELESVFESLTAIDRNTGTEESFSKEACAFGYRDSIFKQKFKGKYIITSITLRLQKDPQVNLSYHALKNALDLKGIDQPDIKDVSNAVIEIRKSKLPDPQQLGNAGSFFKNPVITLSEFNELKEEYPEIPHYKAENGVKIPAAWLIDQCGWKGKKKGNVGVHKDQALVLVNYGKAKGEEILQFSEEIKASVRQRFGISLNMEVNVVGNPA